MDFDEKMLRDYLLRMIADANKNASRVLYFDMKAGGMRGVLELGMDNISDFFTGGKFSPIMREIDRYKESRPKSNLAPYYFFDLNTLLSYSIYVNKIVEYMNNIAMNSGRKYPNKDDLMRAYVKAKDYFLDNQFQRETGGFNARNASTLEKKYKNGVSALAPRTPLSWTEFCKKYDLEDAKRQLVLYVDSMFPVKKAPVQPQQTPKQTEYESFDIFSASYQRTLRESESKTTEVTPVKKEKEPIEVEPAKKKFVYYYKHKKYVLDVVSEEYYTDVNGNGLVSIDAEGENCKLMGMFTTEGEEFSGAYYDLDGNYVNNDDGVIFYHKWFNPMVSVTNAKNEMEDEGM